MQEIKVPNLGEGISTAQIGKVLIEIGQNIEKEEPILELVSDKATIEVPSPFSGKVSEILVKSGDTVNIGDTIAKVEESTDAGVSTQTKSGNKSDSASSSPVLEEENVENLTESSEKKKEQDEVVAKQNTSSAESKVAVATHSQPTPYLAKPTASQMARSNSQTAKQGAITDNPIAAPPSVRRFARELGVDLLDIEGSGDFGRITMEDVKDYVRMHRIVPGAESKDLPDFQRWGETKRETFSPVRRAIAEQVTYAWRNMPHVTQFDEADVTELERYRRQYNDKAIKNKEGQKITLLAMLMKALLGSLQKFPSFNASYDEKREELVYKRYYSLGIAADTERGLLVPVVRDVDKKTIPEIAADLAEKAGKARKGTLLPEEMQGSSFSISNLGFFGTTFFTPIINWPNTAILGVGKAKTTPVYLKDEFVPREILPLSISYDHRVIDGAEAARFLRHVAESLENPWNIFI